MTYRTMKVRLRLDELMCARGLTNAKLFRLTGIGRQTIGDLRNNRLTRVELQTIGGLCAALGLTSLEELFEVFEEDIFFPLRIHGETTMHLGARPATVSSRREPGVIVPRERLGLWDFRAMEHMSSFLTGMLPGVRLAFDDHLSGDPDSETRITAIYDRGNHILFGSPIANEGTERVVCRAFEEVPFSPERRATFPYAFAWPAERAVPSSFGFAGSRGQYGIVARDGTLVAKSTTVPQGLGHDAALIMAYRVFRHRPRARARNDENIVIVIAGVTGLGTMAGMRALMDRSVAEALYPRQQNRPVMGVVQATYIRAPGSVGRETRQITSVQLVAHENAPPTSESPPAPKKSSAIR